MPNRQLIHDFDTTLIVSLNNLVSNSNLTIQGCYWPAYWT